MGAGQSQEGRLALPIHHVVSETARREKAGRQRQGFTGQAGRGGIDDEIKLATGGFGKISGVNRSQVRKVPRQRLRFVNAAVGDKQARRLAGQQGCDHASCGTAGAKQQNPLAGQRKAEVNLDIAHQSGAVGIVAHDFTGSETQRIDRPCALGPGAAPGAQAKGLLLEGDSHIGPLAASSDELAHRSNKAIEWRQQRLVAQVLPTLGGKLRMNGRRAGMGHRIAEHAIAICHFAESWSP